MKSTLLASIVFFTSIIITACSPGEEPAWVYGEWREVLDGETVHFRNDKTVSWFGSEGTFDFSRSAQLLCLDRCPDGDLNIYVDGERYRYGYKLGDGPSDTWELSFHNSVGVGGVGTSDYSVDGKTTQRVFLKRASAFSGPFHPQGAVRFDAGTAELYPQLNEVERIDGQVVGITYRGFVHLNEDTQVWSHVTSDYTYQSVLTPSLALYQEGLSLGGSFTWQYSLDQARSFEAVPELGDVVENQSFNPATFIGTTAYQFFRMLPPEGGDYDNQPYRLYSIDLSAQSPSWSLVHDFASDYFSLGGNVNLVGSDQSGELYLVNCTMFDWNNPPTDNCIVHRSTNGGSSWNVMGNLAVTTIDDIVGTENGFVFLHRPRADGAQQMTVYWYHADSQSFSSTTLPQGEGVYGLQLDGEDVIYKIHDFHVDGPIGEHLPTESDEIIKRLQPDGTITVLAETGSLNAPGDTANLTVGAGYTFLNAVTIWLIE